MGRGSLNVIQSGCTSGSKGKEDLHTCPQSRHIFVWQANYVGHCPLCDVLRVSKVASTPPLHL
jgi:hypothetical protein